mgnify:CR=1 FL=1
MVTDRDRFTKCFGKVFDSQKSKVLILGTLPPYGREWYYQENNLFWEILSEALDVPELAKPNTTARKKKEILIANGIALWDIFQCAWRKEGRAGDEFIISNKDLKANKIYDEILSKGNIDCIIINGLEQALMWFIENNPEPVVKDMISSRKVVSLHQTKWIQTYKSDEPKYRLNWINTIKKALGKSISSDTKSVKPQEIKRPQSTIRKTQAKPVNAKTVNKQETEQKPKKIAFVVKKNKTN